MGLPAVGMKLAQQAGKSGGAGGEESGLPGGLSKIMDMGGILKGLTELLKKPMEMGEELVKGAKKGVEAAESAAPKMGMGRK